MNRHDPYNVSNVLAETAAERGNTSQPPHGEPTIKLVEVGTAIDPRREDSSASYHSDDPYALPNCTFGKRTY